MPEIEKKSKKLRAFQKLLIRLARVLSTIRAGRATEEMFTRKLTKN